jgi:hypothetical protein
MAVQDEVRPYLQFHQDDDIGPEGVQHPADRSAEIQGISNERYLGVGAVQFDAAGVAGLGGDADDETKFGARFGKQANHSPGGVDLAQTHRMDHYRCGFLEISQIACRPCFRPPHPLAQRLEDLATGLGN